MSSILLKSRSLGVLLIHGFTSSPEQMLPFAQELNKYGITCLLPRLSGHENLPDSLTNVKAEDWLQDAEKGFKQLRTEVEHVVIAGHSLGGTLALYLAQHYSKEDGLVAAGVINPAVRLTPEQRRAITFGRFYEKKLDISMKPFQALRKTIDSVRNNLKHVKVPVIIFASSEDELIPHAYQQWLFDRLRATKFFITLPQEGHSPSPEAAEVIIKTFLVLVDTLL